MQGHFAFSLLGFWIGKSYVARWWSTFREITPLEFVYINAAYAALHIFRCTQLQSAERNFYQVASHIAQRSGSVIPPASPVEGHQLIYIVSIRSRSKPKIPVEFLRYIGCLVRPWNTLRPYRPVGPAIYRMDVTYFAGVVPFGH